MSIRYLPLCQSRILKRSFQTRNNFDIIDFLSRRLSISTYSLSAQILGNFAEAFLFQELDNISLGVLLLGLATLNEQYKNRNGPRKLLLELCSDDLVRENSFDQSIDDATLNLDHLTLLRIVLGLFFLHGWIFWYLRHYYL